jgi:hypothetical protein
MMHKRTLHSLLIVSFIVAFASMSFAADQVIVQSKAGLPRCVTQASTVTANIDAPISALEVVLEVTNTTTIDNVGIVWNLPDTILTDRLIDLTDYPLIRFAAMSTGEETEYYSAGTAKPVATINYHTMDVCAGTVDIQGAIWPSLPPLGTIQTQFVDAGTGDIRQVAVTKGTISIANATPTITISGGAPTVLFGHPWSATLTRTDADLANGCETLEYFIQQGPTGMSISGNTVNWTPTGAQICYNDDIIIGVRDKCPAQALTPAFKICVTNTPPAFTAKTDSLGLKVHEISYGDTYSTTLVAVDPDPGPFGPFYNFLGTAPDGMVLDVNTGLLTWNTSLVDPFGGLFTVNVVVNDGAAVCTPCAPQNADTLTFQIRVLYLEVVMEKVEKAVLGQPQVVSITVANNGYAEIAGFDFLVQYDNSAMAFQYAEEGTFITDCKWEYFSYRYGANGNCGAGACPSGILRVVAMAETSGGNLANHPICWQISAGVELVKLHFLLSTDATLECQYAPIRFIWYECADNSLSSKDGEKLFISRSVWDYIGSDLGGSMYTEITGLDNTMPTLTGAPVGECDVVGQKGTPWRTVHFSNGGIDIICADSIDAVGDINLNNIAYEIADAVMFTNYFVNGLSAFGAHVDGSVAASDTNKDGLTLTVADLVYLIRVIIGDAVPYDKVSPVAARVTVGNGMFTVDQAMGAAYVVVAGNATPTLLANNMEMKYAFNGQNTNILVFSLDGNSFTGNFLQVEGEVVSSEFATANGSPVKANLMPANYDLSQNYPNPFNPTTKIKISIPQAGQEWKLNIYNVTGQLVQSFSGVATGFDVVDWNASNVSSGVYFYKLTAGEFSATKKAVLLK